jgi:hypothetical protein
MGRSEDIILKSIETKACFVYFRSLYNLSIETAKFIYWYGQYRHCFLCQHLFICVNQRENFSRHFSISEAVFVIYYGTAGKLLHKQAYMWT